MSGPADVPPQILDRLRRICRRLPETYEEPAWIGVRWRVRTRTVAHVYTPDPQRFPVYAEHVIVGETLTVMTFRVPADGYPFFRAPWGVGKNGDTGGQVVDLRELPGVAGGR